MVEYLKAILAVSQTTHHKILQPDLEKNDLSSVTLSYILDQKELYMDNDMEELKTPLQLQDFSTRAQKILQGLTTDIIK